MIGGQSPHRPLLVPPLHKALGLRNNTLHQSFSFIKNKYLCWGEPSFVVIKKDQIKNPASCLKIDPNSKWLSKADLFLSQKQSLIDVSLLALLGIWFHPAFSWCHKDGHRGPQQEGFHDPGIISIYILLENLLIWPLMAQDRLTNLMQMFSQKKELI